MEAEDKSMERQKLVCDEDDDIPTIPTSNTTQSKTPISPQNVYSGSENSQSQSLGKNSSEAKLSYVNERKSIELENARKAGVERKKKILKETSACETGSACSDSLIDLKRAEERTSVDVDKIDSHPQRKVPTSLPLPSTSSFPLLAKIPSKKLISSSSTQSFASRNIKHHSFDSEIDVKYMEKNLISLLDDFHSGKLRAFTGSSMNQMKLIREQQEKLSKLHFDLGMNTASSSDSKSDHMAQMLVQHLNELSESIEKLNSTTKAEP